MVRIYVIDNGGQWTHREWRTLRDLEVETTIVPNITLFKELQKENSPRACSLWWSTTNRTE